MGKFGDANSNKYCSVPQCKSRCTNEISLFRFPKEETQRKKWTDAIKIEKGITQHMQVCSRHFVKNDYILSDYPGAAKVRRLKKSAVPSQNLPWQFPNKRVSPTLAKARMERLKNRILQKTSDFPVRKSESIGAAKKSGPLTESPKPSPKKAEQNNENAGTMSEDISVDIKIEVDEQLRENKEVPKDNGDKKEQISEEAEEASEAKKDAHNMGGRAPTRLRQRKGVLKCELCGRKCLTPQALQTHQQIAHKNARNNQINLKKQSPVVNKTKSSPKPAPVALISVKNPENLLSKFVPKTLVKTKKPAAKSLNTSDLLEQVLREGDSDFVGTTTDSSDSGNEEITLNNQTQRKTEFECPKCKRRFAVYFMAYKHIEKHHSGGQNGNKSLPHLLLKPNRIEICITCKSTLEENVHTCGGPIKLAQGFVCTGCEQEYKTLTLFDMHKSSMHSDGVESMFFTTLDEFESWKQKMEAQTQVKYSAPEQNDSKQVHRCTHRAARAGRGPQRACPSCVVLHEFTKGFQVHYYPIHYGHHYEKYALSDAFKKYSITTLMNLTASKLPDTDDEAQKETDLYVQFKTLSDVLVTEAARINVSDLKKLMRKALEMVTIVNSYVEDDDDDMTTPMVKLDPDNDDLQEQVRKALLSLKRKPADVKETLPAKRKKSVFQSTENTLKTKIIESRMSNSFNGSNVNEEIENVKSNAPKTCEPKVNQAPSFIDTFQDFVGKTLVKPVERKKRQSDGKKVVVKTKIGQFKPSPTKKSLPSPKSLSPKSPRTSIASVKEIEYEVKEQENDCNILILKI